MTGLWIADWGRQESRTKRDEGVVVSIVGNDTYVEAQT